MKLLFKERNMTEEEWKNSSKKGKSLDKFSEMYAENLFF